MITVDKFSRKPIYEQIVDELEKQIVSGAIRELEQLPSIRELSMTLSINPNTIQKAFAELDLRGIIFSNQGRGCFVAEGARDKIIAYRLSSLSQVTQLVKELASLGIPKEAILSAVEDAYENIIGSDAGKENKQ